MDVEAGRSSAPVTVKNWRRRPNYRRRVRTRGTPHMRVLLVLITFVVLTTTSWVILPNMGEAWQSPLPAGLRRRLSGTAKICLPTEFEKIASGIPALLVFSILLMSLFVGLGGVTDNYFVPSLVVFSDRLHLSEDVAGATFMAAGSSAPELFTSLADTLWTEESNIGIGTIVGSAVFNILVIIACAGAFAPSVLNIDWRPFTRDIMFYAVSIILLFIVTYWDNSCGVVSPTEGFLMFLFYFVYVLFMVFNESFFSLCNDPKARPADESQNTTPTSGDVPDLPPSASRVKSRESVSPMGKLMEGAAKQDGDGDDNDVQFADLAIQDKIVYIFDIPWAFIFQWTIPDVDALDLREELQAIMDKYQAENDESKKENLFTQQDTQRTACEDKEEGYQLAFFISILWIGTIASFMVLLAERCGCIIGVPAPIMGVTVLAAGTSIPDALGSIMAAKSEQGDMAVANAIGSNVFDILIGLGLPYGIYGVTNKTAEIYGGYVVALDGIIAQMVILFLTVVVTFFLFILFNWRLTNGLGYSMILLYAAFCVYSVATANNPRWYAEGSVCTPKPL